MTWTYKDMERFYQRSESVGPFYCLCFAQLQIKNKTQTLEHARGLDSCSLLGYDFERVGLTNLS